MAPLAIDLFCGLGGWTDGLLAEGYRVVGFDCERHAYGDARYRAQLVIQDVLTLHGSQFKDAALIVASPPCQEFSYMAMPWTKAKEKARCLHAGEDDPKRLTALFDACFRIQREAIEAAGHFIPLVVENVCGAQKWVGRARWHYGSFYLWGDVPALMPITRKARKVAGFRFDGSGASFQTASVEASGVKVPTMGAGWYPPDHPKHVPGLAFNGHADRNLRRRTEPGNGVQFTSRDCGIEGVKQSGIAGVRANGKGDRLFQDGAAQHGSKSSARKAASAHIAKIPYTLAAHIAAMWHPQMATDENSR